MVFLNNLFMFSLTLIIFIILLIRLPKLLSYYLDTGYSRIVSYAILFHPYSLDSFFSFHLISGAISFLFFTEAMINYKENSHERSLCYFVASSLFNLPYAFFPIYFFFSHFKEVKKHFPYVVLYTGFLFFFLMAHQFTLPHNPFIFFSYFSEGVIFPLPINIINFGLFPISRSVFIFTFLFVFALLFLNFKKKVPTELMPIIFLPFFASCFSNWTEKYAYWHEFVYSPSSYMPITLGIILIFALCTSKRKIYFYLYFSYVFILSLFWIFSSFPTSRILVESINNLPVNFIYETNSLHKLLADQYQEEGRMDEANKILSDLKIKNYQSPETKPSLPDKDGLIFKEYEPTRK